MVGWEGSEGSGIAMGLMNILPRVVRWEGRRHINGSTPLYFSDLPPTLSFHSIKKLLFKNVILIIIISFILSSSLLLILSFL